jgi:hypothetical protein
MSINKSVRRASVRVGKGVSMKNKCEKVDNSNNDNNNTNNINECFNVQVKR